MESASKPAAGKRARRAVLRGALLCAVMLSGPGGMPVAAQRAVVHTVVIDGMQFSPAKLYVRAGDTVIWQNKDPYPHTATAAGSFDSGEIAAGRSWKFTASKRGAFPYVCTLHPTMKGQLVVK